MSNPGPGDPDALPIDFSVAISSILIWLSPIVGVWREFQILWALVAADPSIGAAATFDRDANILAALEQADRPFNASLGLRFPLPDNDDGTEQDVRPANERNGRVLDVDDGSVKWKELKKHTPFHKAVLV